MVGQSKQNNTPTRNRKVGLPENEGQQQKLNDPNAPAQKVVEAAQQSYMMKHGGVLPNGQKQNGGAPNYATQQTFENAKAVNGWTPDGQPIFGGGTQMAQPMDFFGQGGNIQGEFDQMPSGKQVQQPTAPSGNGGVQQPYMGDAAEKTPQPQSTFEGFQAPQFRADVQPQQQGDLASLSQALANAGGQPQQAQFQADPSQRDGGFFNWLGGILPKRRKGIREGESPEEYDARMARNSKMYFTLADAIRHFGNILNTSKYAPLQQFNDPNAMIEQGYQQRRAERQQRAAQEADMAYKQANMDLSRQKADADAAYKALLLDLNKDRLGLNKDQQEWRKGKDERDYNHKLEREKASDEFKEKKFEADQQQRATSNSLRAQSIAKRGSGGGRSGRSGSGAGAKYWFEGKDGKMHYQPNKTMWEQEYYREYGALPQGETSTSTSSKTINYKTGQETTTTTRKKGASMTSQAAKQQNAAKKARQNQGARGKSKLKNVSALGL